MANLILSPVGVFFIFLLIVMLIYWGSSVIAPRHITGGGKTTMYACGEDLPAKKHNPSAAMFFHIALYFTIMDVAALTIATLPKGASPYLGIFYIVGISSAVIALIFR